MCLFIWNMGKGVGTITYDYDHRKTKFNLKQKENKSEPVPKQECCQDGMAVLQGKTAITLESNVTY